MSKCVECQNYLSDLMCTEPGCRPTGDDSGCSGFVAKLVDVGMAKSPTLHGHPRFYEIIEELKALHSRKNHDYSGTDDPLRNLRAAGRMGIPPWKGVLVRLQDKMSRLESFSTQGELEVKEESLIDTLSDLAVYAILCRILFEESQT